MDDDRKVVSLFTRQTPEEEKSDSEAGLEFAKNETLQTLDLIRERVESGECIGVTAVLGIVNPKSSTVDNFAVYASGVTQTDPGPFLAGVARLTYLFNNFLDENVIEEEETFE